MASKVSPYYSINFNAAIARATTKATSDYRMVAFAQKIGHLALAAITAVGEVFQNIAYIFANIVIGVAVGAKSLFKEKAQEDEDVFAPLERNIANNLYGNDESGQIAIGLLQKVLA